MNLSLIACVAMGVFTTYMGLMMLMTHGQRNAVIPPPPKPTFSASAQVEFDPQTGEKSTLREYTVSTRLADSPAEREKPRP